MTNDSAGTVEQIVEQRRRDIGGGLEVGRVLPFSGGRMIGPFIFFDHIGPATFAAGFPREMDVRPHPHIGLATLTWLFDGEIMHRDSLASQQPIVSGEVNWMTAGRGITHSERFERARAEGGPLHGIQAWVALPDGEEEIDPDFVHVGRESLPRADGPGVEVRLIAGKAWDAKSPVPVRSPLFYAEVRLAAGATLELPADYPERGLYLVSGSLAVGADTYAPGRLLQFRTAAAAVVRAVTPSLVMVLGGDPVGPRHIEWNFVSSSRERIEQAKADWRAGRMKLPDFDHAEFIPLPAAL